MSETIHMALIGRIADRSLFMKGGSKGALLATSEKVAFVPTIRPANIREFTYDELSYLEVSSFLGWRTVTFYTEESELKVRCLASRGEVTALYNFVNERISAAQGDPARTARYFLTQLRAE